MAHIDDLERRQVLSTTVDIQVLNQSQANSATSGLPSSSVYLFMTQENVNTTWTIDPSTGIATPNAPGVLAPSITLAQLAATNGTIKIDASAVVNSARIYLGNSPNVVTLTPSGVVSGPTAGTATFIYDFVEFAMNVQPGILNIDTTQVDQLGIPLTLQVTPNDPNFPAGSGVLPNLDRQTLIANYQAMATGPLAAFADSVVTNPSDPSQVLRLLNPKDVILSQINATGLNGTIATGGVPGAWTATFTITGPGATPPTNGGLAVGMNASGPLLPAGTTIASLPGSPAGNTVVFTSSSTVDTNPFLPTTTPVELFFFSPPATKLATFFDQALDDFFNFYKDNPGTLKVEQNLGGTNTVFTGSVVELPGIPNFDGGTSTYTVLQFTGGGQTFNIYYPFFTTNSVATKTTPFGAIVPPPPSWWAPAQGLKYFEPPSAMVFGADGVFADNTQQATSAPGNPNATLLGALENVVVTALARGTATALQYREGTIVQAPPVNGQFARTATVNLSSGTTAGLTSTMYMASFQIANVPMSPVIPGGSPTSTFTVTSPLPIPPTAGDLLTFSQFYPDGGTWSAFAAFLHNNAGYSVMIDGRAYALPFDDQGGFSSDLNAATSPTAPAAVTITMGAWSPAVSSVRRIGDDLLITGTDAVDVIRILPTRFGELLVLRNGRSLGAYAAARRIIIDGLGGNDVLSTFRGRARIPSTIRGGAGHDRLFGGPGDDVLIGGPGRNRLFGGAGRNRLVHGDAVDPLPVRRPWFTLWRDRQLAARGREDRSVK
jgi:hypothetical protein